MYLEPFLIKNLCSDFEDHERLSKSRGCRCRVILAQMLVSRGLHTAERRLTSDIMSTGISSISFSPPSFLAPVVFPSLLLEILLRSPVVAPIVASAVATRFAFRRGGMLVR